MSFFSWLAGKFVGWLVGWLVGSCVGWLVGLLVACVNACFHIFSDVYVVFVSVSLFFLVFP